MDLADKIRKVEALLAGTATEGEKEAAFLAKQRLVQKADQSPIEYTVTNDSHWKKRLFMAVCAKHGVQTYRYKGQKYTTTMVRVTKGFMNLILWPEFKQYAEAFDELAHDIMHDLIAKIHSVKEEDELVMAGELTAAAVP
jgi:hypothetical protein